MKKLLLITFLFVSIFANATDTTTVSVTLEAGKVTESAPILVIDNITGAQVEATVSNIVIQNNNPSVATVSPYASSIKITRVGVGSGTATVSCKVSYTDAGDGLSKYETKTIIINYTVIGAPNGVKLSLTFN